MAPPHTGMGLLAAQNRMPLHNPVEGEGLAVIDATSPRFGAEVKRLLTTEALSKAAPFLPYALVLANNTGKHIWGFTVVYTFPKSISASGRAWQYQFNHSAGMPDRRYMLEPHASFLITPVADFVASVSASGSRTRQPFLDEGLDRVINVFVSQHLNEPIEASIDSVIFEDGTLVGPDSLRRMDSINARTRASADLVASLNGLKGDELRKQLEMLAKPGLQSGEYFRHMHDTASSLIQLLDGQGEFRVLEALERSRDTKWFGGTNTVRRKQ